MVNALEKIKESDDNRKNSGIYAKRKLGKEHRILDSSKIINKSILLVDGIW